MTWVRFAGLVARHTEEIRAHRRQAVAEARSLAERLELSLVAYFDFVQTNEKGFLYFRNAPSLQTTAGDLKSWAFEQHAKDLRPLVEEGIRTGSWGPIVLPAAGPDEPGQVHNEVAGVSVLGALLIGLFQSIADYDVPKPCSNCCITRIAPNLVYADGTTANIANGVMLHHVVNMNYSSGDITCAPGFSGVINLLGLAAGGNERWYASGNERTIATLKPGYGYRVSSGDDWGLIYRLMNMNPSPRTVYFE